MKIVEGATKNLGAPSTCRIGLDLHTCSVARGRQSDSKGSPDKSGGEFFNSIENLYLCTMNNQGLLALAQLILPSEILSNFEVVRVDNSSLKFEYMATQP